MVSSPARSRNTWVYPTYHGPACLYQTFRSLIFPGQESEILLVQLLPFNVPPETDASWSWPKPEPPVLRALEHVLGPGSVCFLVAPPNLLYF